MIVNKGRENKINKNQLGINDGEFLETILRSKISLQRRMRYWIDSSK